MCLYFFYQFSTKHRHWNNFSQFIEHFHNKALIARGPTDNLSQNPNLCTN